MVACYVESVGAESMRILAVLLLMLGLGGVAMAEENKLQPSNPNNRMMENNGKIYEIWSEGHVCPICNQQDIQSTMPVGNGPHYLCNKCGAAWSEYIGGVAWSIPTEDEKPRFMPNP